MFYLYFLPFVSPFLFDFKSPIISDCATCCAIEVQHLSERSESNVGHLGVWGLSPRGWGNLYTHNLSGTIRHTFCCRSNAHTYGWSFDQHKIYVSMGAYYHNKHAKNASLIFALCQLRQAQFPIGEDYFFFLKFLKSSFSSVFIRVLMQNRYEIGDTLYRRVTPKTYLKWQKVQYL